MYNRSIYNRTTYNRILSEFIWRSIVYGESSGEGALFITRRMSGAGTGETAQDSAITRILYFDGYAEAETTVDGTYIRVLYFSSIAAAQAFAEGKLSHYKKDTFSLTSINMAPADELVIDTDNMTVKLNGVSVIDELDDDSVFFMLKYGENQVTVTGDDGTDKASIKVTHRGRWL